MRLTSENKGKIRGRIRAGAAALFRKRGVDGVTLDDIMESAGLTRGAFYAHYKSKSALFADVVRHEHPLLSLLKARDGADADMLWRQMHEVFRDYLAPAHLPQVFEGCSFAALSGQAARQNSESRAGFEAAWQEVLSDMSRGQGATDKAALHAVLTLAVGAVTTAAALESSAARTSLLRDAWAACERLLNAARG